MCTRWIQCDFQLWAERPLVSALRNGGRMHTLQSQSDSAHFEFLRVAAAHFEFLHAAAAGMCRRNLSRTHTRT